jgi:hypothetical protein
MVGLSGLNRELLPKPTGGLSASKPPRDMGVYNSNSNFHRGKERVPCPHFLKSRSWGRLRANHLPRHEIRIRRCLLGCPSRYFLQMYKIWQCISRRRLYYDSFGGSMFRSRAVLTVFLFLLIYPPTSLTLNCCSSWPLGAPAQLWQFTLLVSSVGDFQLAPY